MEVDVRIFAGLLSCQQCNWPGAKMMIIEIYVTFICCSSPQCLAEVRRQRFSHLHSKAVQVEMLGKNRTRRQLETSNLFSLNKLIDFKLSQLNEISRRVQTFVRVAKTISFFLAGCSMRFVFGRAYCTFLEMKKKQRTINFKQNSLLISLFKAED